MITTTGAFTRSRDIGQTCLRSAGIAAVFLSVLAATAVDVAAADPPPGGGSSPPASEGSPNGGGDNPLHTNTGDPPSSGTVSPPSGGNADTPPPPTPTPPPPTPTPPPATGGHYTPGKPGHIRPVSTVTAQSTTIHHLGSVPVIATPPGLAPIPVGPVPDNSPPQPQRPSASVEPVADHTRDPLTTTQAGRVELALKLNRTAISPGGQVTATGLGCLPATTVTLMVDQSPIGTTRTDEQGGFQIPLTVSSLAVGPHEVTADCGEVKTAALDVVLVSRVGAGAATTTLILIFLVSGVWYFGHRILSPNELRNRNA